MDFNLTEEQLMIQQAARDFAQNELLPGVIERDEHSKFPAEQVKMMADLGFLGMISQAFLIEYRRYSIVINAVVAAIAAPPDTYSMILLMVPLVIMYEISIITVGLFEKKKRVENN